MESTADHPPPPPREYEMVSPLTPSTPQSSTIDAIDDTLRTSASSFPQSTSTCCSSSMSAASATASATTTPITSNAAAQDSTTATTKNNDNAINSTTIVEEAQECLAQSLLMFLYADLRLLSATGRINTKFETLCIDSDRVPRTSAAEMAQLPDRPRSNTMERISEEGGVSPGQIMAILIVELRQEVLTQKRRAREKMTRDREKGWVVAGLATLEDDEGSNASSSDSDDDMDAGVMNKITDRKGRKEFETDMHALIRGYNNMLAQDLRGIPEVKLERIMKFANPLRRASNMHLMAGRGLVGRGGGGNNTNNNPNLNGSSGIRERWRNRVPGHYNLTQRLFSFDEQDQTDPVGDRSSVNGSDDEGSRDSRTSKGSATMGTAGAMKIAARITGSLRGKTRGEERTGSDHAIDPEEPAPQSAAAATGGNNNTNMNESEQNVPPAAAFANSVKASASRRRPQLSLIEESKSEDEMRSSLNDTDRGGGDGETAPTAQVTESLEGDHHSGGNNNNSAGVQKSSAKESMAKIKWAEIIESVRSMKASHARDSEDLHSLKSDPGPNQSWEAGEGPSSSRIRVGAALTSSTQNSNRRPAHTLTKQLTQNLTNYVEKYREDHALHNKLYIPSEDYETFAVAEDVGDQLMRMTSSLNLGAMTAVPELAELALSASGSDPGRNMSESELLDFMTKCIQSRNVESLDFMADFFRDDTISQTMVKSTARVVWLQDWFPIKDCIYAISVDRRKKRVLVVFRGAITRADWSHGFDAAMKRGHNPVKDEYEGKKTFLKIHRGFYTYLFRTRKDTSTRKYDEIATKVYEYGNKMIGSDFTVTVNGYSLGGALSVLFGFYASTDERFTRNGPVKIFSYGAPYAVSHSFADAFRHQEKSRKVQHARFYNSNDIVAHMPFNAKPTKRGSNFVHVGIDVKLYPVPGSASLWGSRYPRFYYNKRQTPGDAYWRAIKLNSFLNMAVPWRIKTVHALPELQKRIARAKLVAEAAKRRKYPFLKSTLDEAYEAMVYKKMK